VGDEVCGFNCTKHKGDQVIVDLIGIDRAFRGRGIGSQLVTRMFADAMAKGIHKSRVGTQAHNVQSVKFYQKHGYSLSDSYCTFHLHL
jgi:ribosomal protein S18 acetylase RimI-like enzyme